jgi:DNA-binding response OmpR family regulator
MKEKKKKILVVDDEPDLTFGCSMTLKLHGFEVDTFNDPLIALSVFKPDTYNLYWMLKCQKWMDLLYIMK